MAEYRKFPYRSEFPDPSERARNHQTLEDALWWARWMVHRVWRETNEYGAEGEYIHDAESAVITNRNTGYRWIMRRGDHRVEFQTPQMFKEAIAKESIDVQLTIEEGEARAQAANGAAIEDSPSSTVTDMPRPTASPVGKGPASQRRRRSAAAGPPANPNP